MRGTSTARFDLSTQNDETRVTWRLDSSLPLHLDETFGWGVVGRYLGLFMDRMVGPDFEQGLSNMKQLAETFPNVDVGGIAPQVVDTPARRLIYVVLDAGADDAETLRRWNGAVAQLTRFAAQNGLAIAGPPLSLASAQDASAGRFQLALPAPYDVMPEDTIVRGRELAAGPAAQLLHRGNVSERRKLVEKLRAWLMVKGLRAQDLLIEEYAEGDLLQGTTRIVFPLPPAASR